MDAISRLVNPRSVAIIGASADPTKTSGRPVAYLRKHGFDGAVYPVNPKVDEIDGLKCYPDIASLPETPDVGIVLLGAQRAHLAVHELSMRGTAAAIVLASGYAEAGATGAQRQEELLKAAGPMRILGPNTIGLVNLTRNIPLSASSALEMDFFPVGSIGVVSQSGGIVGSLLSRAAARGIGLSTLISTSNEVDLDLSDFVSYLAEDATTKVIALYIETIRHPARFQEAVIKAARAGKPVVAFKVGRSESGARAAVSHTGAMAGADNVYEALFKQTGIIRAERFSDLLDIPAALSAGRVLQSRRIAILTSTGGAGTLVSDALGLNGFETPPPDPDTAARLRALQTGDHAALDRNPIDVTLAGLRPDLLRGAIRAVLESDGYGAIGIIVGSSSLAVPDLMASAIRDCLQDSTKPVIAYVSPYAPHITALLNQRGVPAFTEPESCAAALEAMWKVAHQNDSIPVPIMTDHITMPKFEDGPLDEAQAKQLFSCFGISSVRETVVDDVETAQTAAEALGPHVVLKLLSRDIAHKSEVGGVVVGVTAQQMPEQLQAMREKVLAHTGKAPERYLVQEMVSGGVELILGFHRDPVGDAILLGMGGVTAELFKDTTMRLLPAQGGLDRQDAFSMMRELKTWPLLDGYRGRPKADVQALADAIVAFSCMVVQMGVHLVEAEINPLFILPQGQGVKAADGIAVLQMSQPVKCENSYVCG
ncbi:acetate--CoA ligase family protein [Allopusillimonas ginsengisoli]|uniref:acetate--CoA ligase family protein n=1 Tax=Allopusillimonas ginsengisoli TaxID=453575 RepID=UPI001ADCDB62|nr:acetate--CoA ligase family protein [Allopusillimonas ginsengisoli]